MSGSTPAPLWTWWLAPIIAVGCALPLLVSALSGNLTIADEDGWAYSKITELFARTGQIHLIGWNRSSLIGQVVMFGPFGRSLVFQQVAMSVLAGLALWCVYLLARLTLAARGALWATLLVALWPGFATLAVSSMSDIPALLGTFGSLALGAAALRRDSRRFLWVSLIVGLWATTVREQSLLAPATILIGGWVTRSERQEIDGRELIGSAVALAVAVIAFVIWRQSLPRGDHPVYKLAPRQLLSGFANSTMLTWFTLAVPMTPAVALAARGRDHSRAAILAALVVAAIGLIYHMRGISLLAGNNITASGEAQSGRSSIFGPGLATVLEIVALVSGSLMMAIIVDRWRESDPLLNGFTLATLIATIVIGASGQSIVDRYLLALAPGTLAILLADGHRRGAYSLSARSRPARDEANPARGPSRLNRYCALSTLIVLAIFSALLTLNHFAYNRALWNSASALTKTGLPARRIDAGQVWDGTHAPDGVFDQRQMYTAEPVLAMGEELPCVIVGRFTEVHGTRPAGRYHYKRFLLFGSSELNILAVESAANCPSSNP